MLPTLIDTPENTFAFSLKTRLNALGDKLTFLMRAARHDAQSKGLDDLARMATEYSKIDDLVKTLGEKASQTGLMREALVADFSSQSAGAQGKL